MRSEDLELVLRKVQFMQTGATIAFIAAAVIFLVAVALFFLLDIPKVFGDVTGYTARKAIKNIREQNEITGDKAYKPSPVNAARGKVTDKISVYGTVDEKVDENIYGVAVGTSKLKEKRKKTSDENLQQSAEEVQSGYSEFDGTTLLYQNELTESGATTVLNNSSSVSNLRVADSYNGFHVDYEIIFTGSTDLII